MCKSEGISRYGGRASFREHYSLFHNKTHEFAARSRFINVSGINKINKAGVRKRAISREASERSTMESKINTRSLANRSAQSVHLAGDGAGVGPIEN